MNRREKRVSSLKKLSFSQLVTLYWRVYEKEFKSSYKWMSRQCSLDEYERKCEVRRLVEIAKDLKSLDLKGIR